MYLVVFCNQYLNLNMLWNFEFVLKLIVKWIEFICIWMDVHAYELVPCVCIYVVFFSFHRLLSFVLFLLNITTINLDFCLLTIKWIDNLSSIGTKSLQTISFLCSIETHAQQPFCFRNKIENISHTLVKYANQFKRMTRLKAVKQHRYINWKHNTGD